VVSELPLPEGMPENLAPTDKDWQRFDFIHNDGMYMGVIVGRFPDGRYCYMGDVFQDKPRYMALGAEFVDKYFDPAAIVPASFQKYVRKPE
jgi:hypothetical protein